MRLWWTTSKLDEAENDPLHLTTVLDLLSLLMTVRRCGTLPAFISSLQLRHMVCMPFETLLMATLTTYAEIVTVSKSTWSKASSFSDEDCIGATTALALSVNGVYLASACKSGIFVWSTATRRVVARSVVQFS